MKIADVDEEGVVVVRDMTTDELANHTAAVAMIANPVPPAISDRQFFQQLWVQGIISADEMLASNAGTLPASLLTIINGLPLTDNEKIATRMRVGGATTFYRDDQDTIAIGAEYGWTPAQIDDFFRAAAALI